METVTLKLEHYNLLKETYDNIQNGKIVSMKHTGERYERHYGTESQVVAEMAEIVNDGEKERLALVRENNELKRKNKELENKNKELSDKFENLCKMYESRPSDKSYYLEYIAKKQDVAYYKTEIEKVKAKSIWGFIKWRNK
jgi:hypothetical protein